MQENELKAKIAELRQSYTRLALNCKAAGIKVNPQTVRDYIKELAKLQELQIQLN
jgi:ribosomal protein L29